MAGRINVWAIVRDHVRTLKDADDDRYSAADLVLFVVVPGALAGGLWYLGISLTREAVNVLITSLSVFAALLFNLLLLIYDIVRKPPERGELQGFKKLFLQQVYANISFCILISLVAVIVLVISYLELPWPVLTHLVAAVIYYLLLLFILTLFMVLKRVHVLLKQEFEAREAPDPAEG